MKIGIMQPYFFPYIGYFQLIQNVDEFIVYDNIKFTKKGWINRNRIFVNGKDEYITLPLKKDSDFLDIKDRYLAEGWTSEKNKIINRIKESYKKAPNFQEVLPLIESVFNYENNNLFEFIFNSLQQINNFMEIKTPLIISSSIDINHELKGVDKVLAICKAQKAKTYINPIGGIELYNKEIFNQNGLDLKFLKTNEIKYPQFKDDFIPFLSIIDVMMFNSKETIKYHLKNSITYF